MTRTQAAWYLLRVYLFIAVISAPFALFGYHLAAAVN